MIEGRYRSVDERRPPHHHLGMSIATPPQAKMPKLIVVVAFDRDEEGELQPAFGPAEQQSEERAIRTARGLAPKHAGVIAWNGEANPAIGEYGEPTTLFVHGDVPDME
jgi:hypothetical protein